MTEFNTSDELVVEIAFTAPPILKLPTEVRGHIFNLLSPKDATNCRLVCNQFKTDVDEFVEFCAVIDETNGNENGWFLPRILSLRLKEVIVKGLVGPPCLFGHEGTHVLRYPYLLRSLSVPNSKISVENLHYLLQGSASFLQHIDLCLAPPLSTISTIILPQENLPYRLKNVTDFYLRLSTLPSATEEATTFVENQLMRGPPTSLQENVMPVILLSSKFDALRNFHLQIRCLGFRQVSQLSAMVLRIVSNCYLTLRLFDFDLIQGHGLPNAEEKPLSDFDMEKIDLDAFSKVTSLKDVRIVNSTAIGISLWKQLLAYQRKLQRVETDILPASVALFRQIILNNTSTLVVVDIGDLTLDWNEESGTLQPFDLSIFSNCCHLKKLTLDRNSLTRRRGTVLEQELVQLSLLPESLTELNINYFLILSEELLQFFNSLGGNLTSLSLTQCGDSGLFGVNGSVLQKIISLPNIQFIEISPLNYHVVEESEVQKLNLILTTFGYPERHSYFQLNRIDAPASSYDTDTDDTIDMDDLEY